MVEAGDVLGGGTVKTRYYLEVRYRVTPVDTVDEHTDAMMDALLIEPNLIDADVGADLSHGWTDVCAVVEGEDEASALRAGLVAIRSAAHHAGAATPGWEADLDRVMATVRPAELDLDHGHKRGYCVPTQSSDSVESVAQDQLL